MNSNFCVFRPRTLLPMACNQPATTVICWESSLKRSRRPRPSSREACPRLIARWLSGEPNTKLMLSNALRSLRRLSKQHLISKWPQWWLHFTKMFYLTLDYGQFQSHSKAKKTQTFNCSLTGRSWHSAFRRLRNRLRQWTPSVPLLRRPNRGSRVRWKTSWLMWREPMDWLPIWTRSRGTSTR